VLPKPLHKILVLTLGLVVPYYLISAKESKLERIKSLYITSLEEVSLISMLLIFHYNVCIKKSNVSSPCPIHAFSRSDAHPVLFRNTESTVPVNWTSLLSKNKIQIRYIIMNFFVYFMPSNQDTENRHCCDNSFLKAIKKILIVLIYETTKCSTSHCLHKKRH